MVSYSGTGKPGHGYESNSSKDSKILLGRNSGHVLQPKKFSRHKTMATVPVPSATNDHVVHAEWHFKSEDTGIKVELNPGEVLTAGVVQELDQVMESILRLLQTSSELHKNA
ncbi:hypothetical protein SFRURICE_005419 [Spodoptera frugiperda]|uniref:SFRICE_036715 n=1 Tax=Spodoptera frugiperda TaxID=7108 RepID=A0A2H1V594_SPOFR|nr:hypothetical protein SFRURICE_005419 [Spodoptera frugiperda]